jgi:hypothetical protein
MHGHPKTYNKASKQALDRLLGRQMHKITKIPLFNEG